MKKILFLLSIICSSFFAKAQGFNQHELRLDALSALVLPAIEVSYEYALNVHSGVGVATFLRLDTPRDDYESFSLAPFYRQYFYDNQSFGNRGFFIEALLQYTSGKDEEQSITSRDGFTTTDVIEDYNDVGIGFGGGVKWTTPNGFSVEAGAGVGRNFKLDDNSPDFFVRWGIYLGYRFF